MKEYAVQDYYPDDVAICYGCGRNNPHGLQVKTIWNGEEGILKFKPKPYHTAFPGVVYGGLIFSLVDCHATGTATGAAYTAEGREPGTEPEITYVTGTLSVTLLKPVPIDSELELRSRVKEAHERKTIVTVTVYADGEECARGEVVLIRVPSRRNFLERQKGK